MDAALKHPLCRLAKQLAEAVEMISRCLPLLNEEHHGIEHAGLITFDDVLAREADELLQAMQATTVADLADGRIAKQFDRFTDLVNIRCAMLRLAADYGRAFGGDVAVSVASEGAVMKIDVTLADALRMHDVAEAARRERASTSSLAAALRAATGN